MDKKRQAVREAAASPVNIPVSTIMVPNTAGQAPPNVPPVPGNIMEEGVTVPYAEAPPTVVGPIGSGPPPPAPAIVGTPEFRSGSITRGGITLPTQPPPGARGYHSVYGIVPATRGVLREGQGTAWQRGEAPYEQPEQPEQPVRIGKTTLASWAVRVKKGGRKPNKWAFLPKSLRPSLGGWMPDRDTYAARLQQSGMGVDKENKALELYDKWTESIPGRTVGIRRRQDALAQGKAEGDRRAQESLLEGREEAEEVGEEGELSLNEMDMVNEAERKAYTDQIKDQTAKADQALSSMRDFKFRDPYGGMLGRIMAGVSMALGAAGAALAKTPNFAMEIINKNIDTAIKMQEAELDNLKSVAGAEGVLLQHMRSNYSTMEQARQATRTELLNRVKVRIERLRFHSQTKASRIKADQLLASVTEHIKIGGEQMHLMMDVEAKRAQQRARSGRRADIKKMRLARGVAPGTTIHSGHQPKGWLYSKAHYGFIPMAGGADAIKRMGAYGRMITQANRLLKLDKSMGVLRTGEVLNPDDHAEAVSIFTAISLDMRTASMAAHTGAAGMQKMAKDFLGGEPTIVLQSLRNQVPQIRSAAAWLRSREDHELYSGVVRSGHPVSYLETDKKGNLLPDQHPGHVFVETPTEVLKRQREGAVRGAAGMPATRAHPLPVGKSAAK